MHSSRKHDPAPSKNSIDRSHRSLWTWVGLGTLSVGAAIGGFVLYRRWKTQRAVPASDCTSSSDECSDATSSVAAADGDVGVLPETPPALQRGISTKVDIHTEEWQREEDADPGLITGKLSNGLNWMILPRPVPKGVVCLRLVVAAGSVQERENERGIAHLVEHMAFCDTEHFEDDAVNALLEQIGMTPGADVNAETYYDYTAFDLRLTLSEESTAWIDPGKKTEDETRKLTPLERFASLERKLALEIEEEEQLKALQRAREKASEDVSKSGKPPCLQRAVSTLVEPGALELDAQLLAARVGSAQALPSFDEMLLTANWRGATPSWSAQVPKKKLTEASVATVEPDSNAQLVGNSVHVPSTSDQDPLSDTRAEAAPSDAAPMLLRQHSAPVASVREQRQEVGTGDDAVPHRPDDTVDYDTYMLEMCFLALSDFAFRLRPTAARLEREKAVVHEEWRQQLGLQNKAMERDLALVLQGTAYENRSPIGLESVILSADLQSVMLFYLRWYQPQFMTVICCGDIRRPSVLEQLIKKYFSCMHSRTRLELLYRNQPVQLQRPWDSSCACGRPHRGPDYVDPKSADTLRFRQYGEARKRLSEDSDISPIVNVRSYSEWCDDVSDDEVDDADDPIQVDRLLISSDAVADESSGSSVVRLMVRKWKPLKAVSNLYGSREYAGALIIHTALARRLLQLQISGQAPFLLSVDSESAWEVKIISVETIQLRVEAGHEREAVNLLCMELQRLRQHGLAAVEMERILKLFEKCANDAKGFNGAVKPHSEVVPELMAHALYGNIYSSAEQNIRCIKSLWPTITPQFIQRRCEELMDVHNLVLSVNLGTDSQHNSSPAAFGLELRDALLSCIDVPPLDEDGLLPDPETLLDDPAGEDGEKKEVEVTGIDDDQGDSGGCVAERTLDESAGVLYLLLKNGLNVTLKGVDPIDAAEESVKALPVDAATVSDAATDTVISESDMSNQERMFTSQTEDTVELGVHCSLSSSMGLSEAWVLAQGDPDRFLSMQIAPQLNDDFAGMTMEQQLALWYSAEVAVSETLSLSADTKTLELTCSPHCVEVLMKLLRRIFTCTPRQWSDEKFEEETDRINRQRHAASKAHESSSILARRMWKVISGSHPLFMGGCGVDISDMPFTLDIRAAKQYSDSLFEEPREYSVTISGNVPLEELERLTLKYLGRVARKHSKAGSETFESRVNAVLSCLDRVDRHISEVFPSKPQCHVVRAGDVPRAEVRVVFLLPPMTGASVQMVWDLCEFVQRRMFEELRQRMGGVYSVSLFPSCPLGMDCHGTIMMHFTCDPETERVKELLCASFRILHDLKDNGGNAEAVMSFVRTHIARRTTERQSSQYTGRRGDDDGNAQWNDYRLYECLSSPTMYRYTFSDERFAMFVLVPGTGSANASPVGPLGLAGPVDIPSSIEIAGASKSGAKEHLSPPSFSSPSSSVASRGELAQSILQALPQCTRQKRDQHDDILALYREDETRALKSARERARKSLIIATSD